MYYAVSGGDICFSHEEKITLVKFIDRLCADYPSLFHREYITIVSEKEYKECIQ